MSETPHTGHDRLTVLTATVDQLQAEQDRSTQILNIILSAGAILAFAVILQLALIGKLAREIRR